ncbi:hypothetical protein GCM10009839_77600 [Catenulispora yoronensis]|uniref:Uncharacterized protein n=1 Tax=Catenulispora yoronensis TaxID=450799 RepID=A0ABN2VAH7_9ACTN
MTYSDPYEVGDSTVPDAVEPDVGLVAEPTGPAGLADEESAIPGTLVPGAPPFELPPQPARAMIITPIPAAVPGIAAVLPIRRIPRYYPWGE